ncbi:glycosidase [Leeuwenhoekiella polynyae]|uniref:Glycosidase n=2 Tax=Leeuwenhoekiella polynyae TaxID=1550906 RepID=A0A4Q0NWB4_9FLAO|nr:glycosidase [Leeuwenhoekiella polynyae]
MLKDITMKNYINILILFLFTGTLFCCQNDDDATATANLYKQYSMPYANVPVSEDASIYQVNIRAFSEAGNFQGVTDRLDYIQSLGVNVLYLMPIYPVGVERSAGGLGSPYAVQDYKAVNPEFGTLEDLRTLVSAAHEKGMAVVLDFVANHTAWDNAWITEHPEYYQQDADGNIIVPPGTGWNDVAQLNYDNQELRSAIIDALTYWLYTANVDGYRMDAADYVPYTFWSEAITTLENIKSDENLLMLAEGTRTDHFNSGFDYTFGFDFFGTMERVFEGEPVTLLQDSNATMYADVYDDSKRVVKYTTNHDVNLSDGTPIELFGGVKGSIAAFVVDAYMQSVPMIYNGQAIGLNERLEFFTKDPIDWSNVNEDLLAEYKAIIAFRNESTAIRRGKLASYSSDDIATFTMTAGEEQVLVLSNLRNRDVKYILPAGFQNSTWTNAFTGESVSLNTELNLESYKYLILTK